MTAVRDEIALPTIDRATNARAQAVTHTTSNRLFDRYPTTVVFALIAACCQIGYGVPAHADKAPLPPISAFAARSLVEGVTVSPDGRLLATIQTNHGKGVVVVRERDGTGADSHAVLSEPDRIQIRWCRWATNTRLLCGYGGMTSMYGRYYLATRLVGVDADGKNMKVLIQDSVMAQGQNQDRVLQWNPGPPNTILVEADEGIGQGTKGLTTGGNVSVYGNIGTHGAPAVFELNVVTGSMSIRQHSRRPIYHWYADRSGQVRLGWGQDGGELSYYARLARDTEWRRLAKFELFSRGNHFDPIAISYEDPNKAYALAGSEGREAVWLMDLTDKEDPTLVFAHPVVDVTDPLLARDSHLLGIHYENEYPNIYFTDDSAARLNTTIKSALPGVFSTVAGSSLDDSVYVIRSRSDVKPTSYSILDLTKRSLVAVGGPSADLASVRLAQMRPIHYAARDGVDIPGYLTTPRALEPKNLPLIIMPHGGPISRDRWGYDFLVQFLASRGYAVLQMNFRGSGGYGEDWYFAAHQDWGGLTYNDVVDGARWAIDQKIADPNRLCIVGWSFGGYVALLGAQRNRDLFQCSVDIAGVSDLQALVDDGYNWMHGHAYRQLQLGTDADKLRRDSPRRHAAEFNMPLLIVHGDHDAQVPIHQSQIMAAALDKAGKPYRLIEIKDADHSLSDESDRVTLLTALEAFLAANLNPAAGVAH